MIRVVTHPLTMETQSPTFQLLVETGSSSISDTCEGQDVQRPDLLEAELMMGSPDASKKAARCSTEAGTRHLESVEGGDDDQILFPGSGLA